MPSEQRRQGFQGRETPPTPIDQRSDLKGFGDGFPARFFQTDLSRRLGLPPLPAGPRTTNQPANHQSLFLGQMSGRIARRSIGWPTTPFTNGMATTSTQATVHGARCMVRSAAVRPASSASRPAPARGAASAAQRLVRCPKPNRFTTADRHPQPSRSRLTLTQRCIPTV